jgi:hypothetical protein
MPTIPEVLAAEPWQRQEQRTQLTPHVATLSLTTWDFLILKIGQHRLSAVGAGFPIFDRVYAF